MLGLHCASAGCSIQIPGAVPLIIPTGSLGLDKQKQPDAIEP